jgi:hypothetical protein
VSKVSLFKMLHSLFIWPNTKHPDPNDDFHQNVRRKNIPEDVFVDLSATMRFYASLMKEQLGKMRVMRVNCPQVKTRRAHKRAAPPSTLHLALRVEQPEKLKISRRAFCLQYRFGFISVSNVNLDPLCR